MSMNCNGVKTPTRRTPGKKTKNGKRRFSVDAATANSFSNEDAFPGFAKSPVVVLTRTDISPYLKSMQQKAEVKSHLQNSLSKLEFAVHARRLEAKCSVSVLLDDLSSLKMAFQKDPNNPSFKTSFNMAKLKCKICDKIYSSEKKLQNHQENKHMIIYKSNGRTPKRVSFSDHVVVHEVTEYHKCRKCTKIFEHYRSLKLHMKQKHKKRKCYICHYCNKNFVDRMFFKVHIKLHCDVCGELAPNRSKYLEHRRNICRVFKLHKCKTCNTSFFNFMDLKDHSYDHSTTVYICDICKDQFPSKCLVAHHISFLHSEKQPMALYTMRSLGSERLYTCNFCEDIYVDHDEIEKHVVVLPDLKNRAMTGYKDHYFCDQCSKKFDFETDMLHHKWTHFLKTSDNSQLRPNGVKPETKIIYKIAEDIPEYFQPKVVLEKVKIDSAERLDSVDVICLDEDTETKMPAVDPVSIIEESKKPKKTIISNHQCQICGKYYSSNYCLNRHIVSMHSDYETLKCKVCEETFVWPSLLHNHKCIRLNLPELPFEDARPEVHFDNLDQLENGFDELPITDDNYLNSIDFEIPAPIVELNEIDQVWSTQEPYAGCKIMIHEVPIEF